ncbi:hypothetical protein [Pseudomonas sp.]|uniref:hypothetical protein n=1 Tax=Pseudomonas sp. TaxID=306 RepID=UPI002730A6CB|nr:hypothetical protein [Pseudomonas sp.]MDP2244003.1 hypothetical protein [Pseudomonas sp.]
MAEIKPIKLADLGGGSGRLEEFGESDTLPLSSMPPEIPEALADKVDKSAGKGLSTEDYTTEDKAKLGDIAANATANSSDAALLDRGNHTGTQAISTIEGLSAELAGKESGGTSAAAVAAHVAQDDPHAQYALETAVAAALAGKATTAQGALADGAIQSVEKGEALGVATLDAAGKVPAIQLPSYVDDVLEAADFASLPATGEAGKIYVTLDSNKAWRWGGSAYTEISASPGTTDNVPEGANLYHTAARVRAALLTGLSLATSTVVAETDSLLQAIGKLAGRLALAFDRANHTGAQAISTVTGLGTALDEKVDKATGQSLMTDAERIKLGDVAAGAQVNVATNLAQGTRTTTTVVIESSTGEDATLDAATDTLAGVMSAADKVVVAGVPDALAAKQDTLISATNIKTLNGQTLLGSGNIELEAGGGGGGGLTYFEDSRSTASPNAAVPVHALTALGDEANIDFVIAPKGTGAILAQVPDGASTGGNKRGQGSVDLQLQRSSAAQVASGNRSFLAGSTNTASGAASFSAGFANVSSGSTSYTFGQYCVASGDWSSATGFYTTTRSIVGAIAEGFAASSGRQQVERFLLRWDTTTAESQRLTTDGYALTAARAPVMPNNSAYYCRIRVLARNTGTNEAMSWSGTALIKRGANAASTTLVGSTITSDFGDAAMSDCTVTLSADTTRGALAVIVTGLASTSIRWVAQLETVEAA